MTNQPDGTSAATIVNVDEGLEIPVSALTHTAVGLALEIKAIGGSYSATLAAAGTELIGTITQGSVSVPLTFRRAEK